MAIVSRIPGFADIIIITGTKNDFTLKKEHTGNYVRCICYYCAYNRLQKEKTG